jgi:beta-catenin-like protein 1
MEAKSRCIKVLDYAMSGPEGAPVCNAFVEALGLKTIFTAFMGKVWILLYRLLLTYIPCRPSKRLKAIELIHASDDVAHSLGIISSLLTNLPADSNSLLRLLAKFVDNDYEKIDKLIEIREAARKRLKDTDLRLQQEQQVSSKFTLVPK